MLSKKVKSRIFFLFIALILASIVIFILFKTLEKNVVYFLSTTEINNNTNISFDKMGFSSNREFALNIGAFLFIRAEGSSEGSFLVIKK